MFNGAFSVKRLHADGTGDQATGAASGEVRGNILRTDEADTRHANRTTVFGAASADAENTWAFTYSTAFAPAWIGTGGGDTSLAYSIDLPVGARIKEVHAFIRDQTADAVTFQLWKGAPTNTAQTQIGSTQTSAGNNTDQTLSITGLTETLATDTVYYARIQGGSHAQHRSYGIKVIFDRP